ncbi:hypothetical protein FHT78_005470 [Rhizobium sp. BK196]|uniref:hypothetical protein n=1 Tax=Rhizobium sp. BK196 TaxID=2587073 RepID=UPI001607DD68|nr:hypothetical protein [Rhizobium sp. BK196]MBB3313676.1 hypothetical protein [Rhizobium sp. BK196]
MELNQERIEAAIVAEVADKIIGEEELFSRVRTAVDARIAQLFKDQADAQIRSAIDAAIQSGFDREYTRVNSWGEREGKPTTIRKELEKVIGNYWNEKVGKDGKPSSYASDRDITRAEWIMAKMVAADFNAEMQQHVVNVGGALKDQLRASLHGTVNELLSGIFRVNSHGDQEIKKSDGRTGYVGNLPTGGAA